MSSSPPVGWFPGDNSKNPYSLNSRILATAILSLMFVISLLVVLHLYVRCILHRRQLDRRSRTIPSNFLYIFSSTHGGDPPPPPTGLNPTAIAALPTSTYRSSGDDTTIECAVCLSAVEDGETVRLLPSCKHVFHVDCIDMWLRSHSTCPVCRATAEAPLLPPAAAVEVVTDPPLCEGCVGTRGVKEEGAAAVASTSRLSSSFRKMLSRGASGRRGGQGDGVEDLERQ